MNIDWFEPFEHVTYSVGVIYLAVLNLPWSIRYKRENVILVGIIPGPFESHLSINTYLSPLVTELVQLWEGLKFQVYGYAVQQSVRAVLLMVGCDLPAARKVCGFPSHSATSGCSRCFCSFSRGFGNNDYSNFEWDSWELRTNERHRANVKKLEQIYCLYDLLSVDEIEYWRQFVLACRILCKKELTQDDITVVDALLLHFCERVRCIYGSSTITPNMHLHAHLAMCVRQYGPLHGFWLFSFERCNGVLGSQPHNT